jgi:hypothetical protein
MASHHPVSRIWNLPEFAPALVSLVTGVALLGFGLPHSLDSRLYYTIDEARSFVASLPTREAVLYFRGECIDLVFLCSYSILFFRLLKRTCAPESSLPAIALLPFGFDWVETSTLALILAPALVGGPVGDLPDWLPWMTGGKWFGLGINLGLMIRGGFRPGNQAD